MAGRIDFATFGNGFTSVPYSSSFNSSSTASYKVIAGICYLAGRFTKNNGNIVDGDILGTMPPSTRPIEFPHIVPVSTSGSNVVKIRITPDGQIHSDSAGGSYVEVGAISYPLV